jgi:hypothetical protein
VQVPKYFLPLAFMAASMLWAACREKRGSGEGRALANEATERMVMRSNFMVAVDVNDCIDVIKQEICCDLLILSLIYDMDTGYATR